MLAWPWFKRVTMQLLQIDFTPAIVVLGVGCLIAVGLKMFEAHTDRRAAERTNKLLRELDDYVRSRAE